MGYTFHTLLSKPANYGGARRESAIKYIVLHYTGNRTDTAYANANYFHSNVVKASAHYFVDDKDVYQSVPDTVIAWSVGGKKYANASRTGGGTMHGIITNANSISIEMCSKNGVIASDTQANAVKLALSLMDKYNIPFANLYRHFDVTGKACPGWSGWIGSDTSKWVAFKKRFTTAPSAGIANEAQGGTITQKASTAKKASDYISEVAKKMTTLKKGSKGKAVKVWQTILGNVTIDGDFGSRTHAATVAWQKTHGLTADGIVGQCTWTAGLKSL